jgi:drug/metabolite transporter (DMT)-like permease
MHFIIFIWGFTAVLGALISLDSLSLTWYRLLIAIVFLGGWIWLKGGFKTAFSRYDLKHFALNGMLIGLHWLLFFQAIKTGGVSVTLVSLSSGAFFASLLEPLIYKRKPLFYEFIFGLMIIGIMYYIFEINNVHWAAVFYAVSAAFLGSLFSVFNGLLIHRYKAEHLSFFELGFAWLLISLIILFSSGYKDVFHLSLQDLFWLVLLGSICTAYAFTVSLNILKKVSPYTLSLSINLEPVYGIILALLIFGEKEKMPVNFYAGAFLILVLVALEGIIKFRKT